MPRERAVEGNSVGLVEVQQREIDGVVEHGAQSDNHNAVQPKLQRSSLISVCDLSARERSCRIYLYERPSTTIEEVCYGELPGSRSSQVPAAISQSTRFEAHDRAYESKGDGQEENKMLRAIQIGGCIRADALQIT